jgi:hypothetical protein
MSRGSRIDVLYIKIRYIKYLTLHEHTRHNNEPDARAGERRAA